MTDEPKQEETKTPDLRRKWAFPKYKRGRDLKAHLMSTNETTFCGRNMVPGITMDFDDWCPLDHPTKVCPRCLEWWKTMRPGEYGKKKTRAKS